MKKLIVAVVVIACFAFGAWYYVRVLSAGEEEFALYGNVEFKQADLAFNASQRIAEILVSEGDEVASGQVLARLDSATVRPMVAQAQAQVAYNRAVLSELRAGSRMEELAQAEANLRAAQVQAANLKLQLDRRAQLFGTDTVSQQAFDQAKADYDIAAAKVDVSQRSYDLVKAGPRREKIDQAEAQLKASQGQLASLEQQLADTELKAPSAGVVRSRLMEPGEIAVPSRAVLSLALPDPKWIRAYVSEPQLGKLRSGAPVSIHSDSFPDRDFKGRIGFISPVSEFTPKTVETQDLRTSLVYEVRIHVEDPEDLLRLGMPATVRLTEAAAGARP